MRRLLAVLSVLVAACGKDASGPSLPKLNGSWSGNWWNLSGGGLSNCETAGGLQLSITQNGATFTGGYSSGTIGCNGSIIGTFPAGKIVNGSVNGSAVTLDLDTPDYHQTGTIIADPGTRMSGTATWRYVDSTGTVHLLTGNWGASQQ